MPYPVLPQRSYGFTPRMTEEDMLGPPIVLDSRKLAGIVAATFAPTREQANTAANRIEAFLAGHLDGYDLSDGDVQDVLFHLVKTLAGLGGDDVQCKLSILAGWNQLLTSNRIQCVDGRAAITVKPSRRPQPGKRSGKKSWQNRGAQSFAFRTA